MTHALEDLVEKVNVHLALSHHKPSGSLAQVIPPHSTMRAYARRDCQVAQCIVAGPGRLEEGSRGSEERGGFESI